MKKSSAGGATELQSSSPQPTVKTTEASTTPVRDKRCVRAFTNPFQKLVNGVVTVPSGKEVYRDAHLGLLQQKMLADKDSTQDEVLSKLWDALDDETQDHWEKEANQSIPTSE